jgi:pimeloyl-ACP methyl ester carboxylesterase
LGRCVAVLTFLLPIGAAEARPASIPNMIAFFDAGRHRTVPVALYGYRAEGRARPLALISHGLGAAATDYGFLAEALVKRGFLVASIQHVELPGDPPMAMAGNLAQLRRPVWQIGADSIGFVERQLRASGLTDPAAGLLLIGHSNGGDMTMLFATQHPERVAAAISLDNRRMPLPRIAAPRICSMRSSDQPADPGVLPDAAKQARLGMVVVAVPVTHNDMDDGATDPQRRDMLRVVDACLRRLSLRRR